MTEPDGIGMSKEKNTKWSEEEKKLNVGIRMGLAKALQACKEVDLIGADDCEEKIRDLMMAQNERINENAKS